MTVQTLRWGLLSTARINKALFEPLRTSKRNCLVAVASRSLDTAEAYARQHKIGRAYGSYEALLADPQVDVIYNPLPNHLHAEWTIKAVEAGKHVLCEKPLALTLDEVDAMADAAQRHGRVVAEAFMYRTHPQTLEVQRIVQGGKLGQVKMVRGSFTFVLDNSGDIRLDPAMGGGALWDIGCYPLSYTRSVLGAEPVEAFGWQVTGKTGVDLAFVAQMRFPGEVYAQFDCNFGVPYHVFMEIVGSEGTLVVPTPFCPGLNEKVYLTTQGKKKKTEALLVKGLIPYLSEVEDMADAVLLGREPRVSLADSRANTQAILALFESARTGKVVSL
ncbi:MAG: Gfo/Idh/MocA family oxidoreductase [Anaerolineales bacterium]|nr:Gfo/Idh/MocA family oxidoreductase [Anaerolineales bacterium]